MQIKIFHKEKLSLFLQSNFGSGSTLFRSEEQSVINDGTFNYFIQAGTEIGARYQIKNNWNLLIYFPAISYRFEVDNIQTYDTLRLGSVDSQEGKTHNIDFNTSFTNLNIGIEKLF